MSRIGKAPVTFSEGTTVEFSRPTVTVTGPKGTLTLDVDAFVSVEVADNTVNVSVEKGEEKEQKSVWGLVRSLIANMVEGVEKGFTKSLEISGVGYKFDIQGTNLQLSVGYSHKVDVAIPEDVAIAYDEKDQNIVHITGIDKQRVGQFASLVRDVKKPEPYKGKGIHYLGEYIKRKAGKTGTK